MTSVDDVEKEGDGDHEPKPADDINEAKATVDVPGGKEVSKIVVTKYESRPSTAASIPHSAVKSQAAPGNGTTEDGVQGGAPGETADHPKKFDDYDFMKEIPRGDMWEPIGDGPAKSFDFGAEGYTASMNVGHEFLQLTAPDPSCGLIYVRGSFSNDPGAMLARAQRRIGGKSTFGLKVVPDENAHYELGLSGDEGLLNFRWPFIEFPLKSEDCETGTCSVFSFVRRGIVYQVLRLVPGIVKAEDDKSDDPDGNTKPSENAESGPSKRHGPDRGKDPAAAAQKPKPVADRRLKLRVGGRVRIGCICERLVMKQGDYVVETRDSTLTCLSPYYKKRLEIQLWINGEKLDMSVEKVEKSSTDIDTAFEKWITLVPGETTLAVATFRIRDEEDALPTYELPTSAELTQDLGVAKNSEYATDRVWLDQIEATGGPDYHDTCAGASCLEQILGVTSIPMVKLPMPPPPPSSRSRRSSDLSPPPKSPSNVQFDRLTTSPIIDKRKASSSTMSQAEEPLDDAAKVASTVKSAEKPASCHSRNSQASEPFPISAASQFLASHERAKESTESFPPQTIDLLQGNEESNIESRKQQVGEDLLLESSRPLAQELGEPSTDAGPVEVMAAVNDSITIPPKKLSPSPSITSLRNHASTPMSKPEQRSTQSLRPAKLAIDTTQGTGSGISQKPNSVGDSQPHTGGTDQPPHGHEEDDDDPDLGIALLGGILGYQYVDLQRSFWQIRYLVKVYDFLSAPRGSPSSSHDESPKGPPPLDREDSTLLDSQTLEIIRSSLLFRIKFTIHHALIWIANARLSPYFHASPAPFPFKRGRRPVCAFFLNPDTDYDRTLYPPIAIWYVIKNCRVAIPRSFLLSVRRNLARLKNQYIGNEDLNDPEQRAKLCLLIWYYYGCLDKIYQLLFDSPDFDAWQDFEDFDNKSSLVRAVEEDRSEIRRKTKSWQKKSEKVMAASRRHLDEPYSDEFEIVDRLAFLGIELGLVAKQAIKQSSSCVTQARRRILDRSSTKALNPGKPLSGQDNTRRSSTKSPWELTCVNHHSRLASALWDNAEFDDDEIQLVRNDYHRFMTSNFTYVGSWDMSRNTSGSWWDLDPSCVISSTRLEMRIKNSVSNPVKVDADGLTVSKSPVTRQQPASPAILSPVQVPDENVTGKFKSDIRGKRDLQEDGILELLKKQVAQQGQILQSFKTENDIVFDFDWIRCSPPPLFHPDSWVHSLDDTPERFQSAQTKTVQLRKELLKYLVDRLKDERKRQPPETALPSLEEAVEKAILQPEWTVETIQNEFDVEELSYISVADINTLPDGRVESEGVYGRLFIQDIVTGKDEDGDDEYFEFYDGDDNNNAYGPNAEDLALALWISFLNGTLKEDSPEFDRFPDQLKRKFNNLSPQQKATLQDPKTQLEVKEYLKKNLLNALNDSLVDSLARHRIFFIQRCSPAIVRAFIYMWHTQAIDTFDDHFGDSSSFFDSKKEVWITSISISYWGFWTEGNGSQDRFHEGRDEAAFPPKKVIPRRKTKKRWWKKTSKEKILTKYIEEGSSSLVISGDKSGNWWMCSVISTVLPEVAMKRVIDESHLTLEEFSHQPATARCLVFLSFLGALCECLSVEYEDILKELTVVIKLGREVLKKGLEKAHAEDAIMRLKSMLWALEALRIFDDRLGESLDKINDAKVKMQNYVSHGPGRRQEQLERQCQIHLEDFDKRYGRLASVHAKIEQKIVQISRYREGITAVSNLEDTHTALKQNDTIRILTYITIAYLPISFVAAVFSMDIVTSSNWSAKIFGGMIVAFLVTTIVLARSLAGIIEIWDDWMKFYSTKKKKRKKKYVEESDDNEDEEKEIENIVPAEKVKAPEPATEKPAQPPHGWPLDYVRKRKTASKHGSFEVAREEANGKGH